MNFIKGANQNQYNDFILNSINDAVIVTDLNGRINYWNKAAEELYKWKSEEVINKSIESITPSKASKKQAEEIMLALKKGNSWEGEFEVQDKNGTVFPAHVKNSPLIDKNGKLIGIIGISRTFPAELKYWEMAREKEEKYKSITENIPGMVYRANADWSIDTISNSHSITGYSDKDFISGKVNWMDTIHPEDRDSVFSESEILLKSEASLTQEYSIITRDKSVRHIADYKRSIFKNGKLAFIDGVILDITKQHENEQKLKQSDRVFNLTLDLFCIAGFDGYFKYLNPAWERTLGWSIKELMSKPWLEFVHPDDKGKNNNGELFIVNGKEIRQFENRYICKDGSAKWLSWNVHAYSNEHNIIGAARDISESKEAEKELIKVTKKALENEKNFKIIFNQAPLGIALINSVTGFIYEVNPMFAQIAGRTIEQMQNIDWMSITHPDDIQEDLDNMALLNEGKIKGFQMEKRYIRPDGTIVWINMTIAPLKEENAEDKRHLTMIEDISYRKVKEIELNEKTRQIAAHNLEYESINEKLKQTNEELIVAKEKAEESERLKSAFLANMSHEIRTPMNGIMGFTSLLQRQNLTGEQQQQYIEIIQKSGDRMLNTVNDIVEISKIDSGQIKVLYGEINISEYLLTLHEFFKYEAEKKGLILLIDNKLSKEESSISTDKNKLGSILTNLIKNAIKYTEKGTIVIGCKKSAGLLEFCVKDTGIGIPSDRKEAIFNRFEQADIEDKLVHEGSGLGLAISKAYAEMLDGDIWVESEEGVGSQFYFTIPIVTTDNEISKKILASGEKGSLRKGLKILVVEDDETSIAYLSNLLKEHKQDLLFAKTGYEAVEMCRNYPELDVVLMDIKLPGIDGYEASRQIREFNREIIILAQTAYALSGDREKSIKAGCNDYISKPLDKDRLISLINKYI